MQTGISGECVRFVLDLWAGAVSPCADFGNNQILLFLRPRCSLGVHPGLVQGWAPRLGISLTMGSAHPC